MRWNLTSQGRELSGGDAVVISLPRSGWRSLSIFVNSYFTLKTGWPFSSDVIELGAAGAPRIIYSHDRFEARTRSTLRERLLGAYLLPRAQTRRAPVILLARHPRDCFLAYAADLKRGGPAVPPAIRRLSPGALVRHRKFGIANMVTVMNRWLEEFGHRDDFHILRYEDFHYDAGEAFRGLLEALGETQMSLAPFCEALGFWNVMSLQLEQKASRILLAGDEAAAALKVTRSERKGPAQYLSRAGQEYIAAACAQLDPQFGYRAQASAAPPARMQPIRISSAA